MVLAATFGTAVVEAVDALQLVASADASARRASRLEAAAAGEVLGGCAGAPACLRVQTLRLGRRVAGAVDGGVGDRTAVGHVSVAAPPRSDRGHCLVGTARSASRPSRRASRTGPSACRANRRGRRRLVHGHRQRGLRGRLPERKRAGAFGAGDAGVTADGRPVDGARGDDCPVAAVHAAAGIFAGGVEIHDPLARPTPTTAIGMSASHLSALGWQVRRRVPRCRRSRRRSRGRRASGRITPPGRHRLPRTRRRWSPVAVSSSRVRRSDDRGRGERGRGAPAARRPGRRSCRSARSAEYRFAGGSSCAAICACAAISGWTGPCTRGAWRWTRPCRSACRATGASGLCRERPGRSSSSWIHEYAGCFTPRTNGLYALRKL